MSENFKTMGIDFIDSNDTYLYINEAQELYKQLSKLFNNMYTPYVFNYLTGTEYSNKIL
jgi:hypothetical protein